MISFLMFVVRIFLYLTAASFFMSAIISFSQGTKGGIGAAIFLAFFGCLLVLGTLRFKRKPRADIEMFYEVTTDEGALRSDVAEIRPDVARLLLKKNPRNKAFSILYEDAGEVITRRTIRVYEVVQTRNGGYVAEAACLLAKDKRHFRLDRILSIERAD